MMMGKKTKKSLAKYFSDKLGKKKKKMDGKGGGPINMAKFKTDSMGLAGAMKGMMADGKIKK